MAVEYIQKDTNVSGYMAVSHDQVISITRKHFIENGIIIIPEQKDGEVITEKNLDAKVPVKMLLYSGVYHIKFVNVDKPEDMVSVCVNAHAADNGDKAPGKAITYATKTAILKVLSLETGVNDESRTYEPTLYRPEEKEAFDLILENDDYMGAVVMQQTMSVDVYTALFNSFDKGEITKNKNRVRDLCKRGWEEFNNIVNQIEVGEDSTVLESTGELSDQEKKVLWKLLNEEQQDYLKGLKE